MLKIRLAVREDATEILRVRREAVLAKAASHYAPEILNDWAHAVAAGRIARQISDPDYRVLVAEVGGEIIGFAMVILSKRTEGALHPAQSDRRNRARAAFGNRKSGFSARATSGLRSVVECRGLLHGQWLRRGEPGGSGVPQRGHFARGVDEEGAVGWRSAVMRGFKRSARR